MGQGLAFQKSTIPLNHIPLSKPVLSIIFLYQKLIVNQKATLDPVHSKYPTHFVPLHLHSSKLLREETPTPRQCKCQSEIIVVVVPYNLNPLKVVTIVVAVQLSPIPHHQRPVH
jgi:hypothetical protein